MLEGLDEVNWEELNHAGGEASDVPGLLRGLGAEEFEEQEEALEQLSFTIWDMGEIYSATAPAVPYLYELLAAEHVQVKENLAMLLAGIAGVAGMGEEDDEVLGKVRSASSAGLRQLLPYLTAYEIELRELVASALGHYPEHAVWALPAIEKALETEAEESVRDALEASKESLNLD